MTIRRDYAWCCQWRVSPGQVRRQLAPTRQQACHYRRIARLPLDIGRALDAAGISYRRLRYVAFGDGRIEQERRFAEVMASASATQGEHEGRKEE